jgi:subfamily B ATP-binding cassette protein MsbA
MSPGSAKRRAMRLLPRHRALLRMVLQAWPRLLLAGVCLVVVAASTSATAYLIKPALDDVFIQKDLRMLRLIPAAVVLLYLLRGVGMYGQSYLLNWVGQEIIRRLRDRLYGHIQDLPLSYFQSERTGVLMSRISNDVTVVKHMVSTTLTGALKDLVSIAGLLGVILYQIWELALLAVAVLPVAYLPIVRLGRRMRRISTGSQEAMAEMSAFLHETLAGNKIVKAFGMEEFEKARFQQRSLKLFRLEIKDVVVRALSSPVMEILAGIGIAFIIWYGGSRVIGGHYTTGTFISFLAAVIMLYDPVKSLSKFNIAVQQGLAAADRIFDVLETPPTVREAPDAVEIARRPHRVEFRRVTFSYGGEPVLREIDLDLQPGQVLALVGMSGGGKSSLVNLIPRFYDVTGGAILIDGLDIRRTSLRSLRQQIAIVTQEPILFNDTVRNNIAYGRPEAPAAAVEDAARAAYALEFIRRLPRGFETEIGELGGRLSGGEKQRLCIARALFKDAPILILDEATSSLDTEAERIVQQALENLIRGRTTFVIAHRLSTIRYADRIAALAAGRIVEQGSHAELLALRGEYWRLHRLQFGDDHGARAPAGGAR